MRRRMNPSPMRSTHDPTRKVSRLRLHITKRMSHPASVSTDGTTLLTLPRTPMLMPILMWMCAMSITVHAHAHDKTQAQAPQTDTPVEAEEHRFRVSAVPTATFNTDEGFGFGGVVSMYHDHEDIKPYRDALTFNIFVSTKWVQAHAITWDALKPFGLPGRLYARAGYFSTVSQNYCGTGNAVTCAPADARAAADARDLDSDFYLDTARDDFVRRYHLMRFIRPFGVAIGRVWLRDKPMRVELMAGWRGSYTWPGDLQQAGPYPGSRYAQDFPRGEQGFSSVPMLGMIVDDRDDEIFPTRGFFAEASVRAAQPWTFAQWHYVGGNAIAAGFFDLMPSSWKQPGGPRAVLAVRGIVDVLLGNPSTEELARIGGTLDPIAFGGSALGRGIREHRYLGKIKAIAQAEVRTQLWQTELWGEHFDLGAAVFSDVGMIGYDAFDWRGHPLALLPTVGVSWRILWNQTFAIRWDLATSPAEAEGPGFYIIVGQAF
jgi:hypothetical protein